MSIFFIEENDRLSFKNIQITNSKIIINKNIRNKNFKKKIKLINKINEILLKNKCKQVILSENLKKDEEFCDLLLSKNISIINGKGLFKKLIIKIVQKIINDNNFKKEETEVSFTINEYSDIIKEYIKKLANEFKRIGIVTNHITKFKKIENELYEENGILINVTNNRRKSLIKSDIILNIDFAEETLNKFSINDNAIIVNFEENIKINKKRFCGKIFNNYAIEIYNQDEVNEWFNKIGIDIEKYDLNDIIEVYYKINYIEIQDFANITLY